MSALIEARNVTVRFSSSAPEAVADVSLDIEKRAAIGIVGESGSGKTTLARVLVGALRQSQGEVLVGGRPWASVKRTDALRRSVQMIFQNPYDSLNPFHTARDAVAEVLLNWKLCGRKDADEQADLRLQEVGLSQDAIESRPPRLSGGQCQRVGIARALACDPDVLVADEPTSSLDVSVQGQILNLLLALRETRDLALVFISHDLAVVSRITTDVLVMYKGRVVESGPTTEVLAHPQDPYTKLLVESIPGRQAASHVAADQSSDYDEDSVSSIGARMSHPSGSDGEQGLPP
jgi:ABC-type glutathione transport system ATPase component